YVGGGGVARGYLNRPELTEQRFIPNPFSPDDCEKAKASERLYRTGDLARWLPGRELEYLGRIDHQVKIRGFRIELGEVQSILSQHPSVLESVVIVRTEADGEKRLIAYYVSQQGDAPDLRGHLKKHLPDYMVPAVFVLMDRLPLTSNGKVDLRALPCPAAQPGDLANASAMPGTALEQEIATHWRELLRIEHVGLDSNFFELGGHSLLLIQLHSRLRLSRSKDLTITDLFQHPTVRTLAQHISAGAADTAPAANTLSIRERGKLQRTAWKATARPTLTPKS
ncbi:MAG: non-ribosomal peptide synthetase, partial [Verrucomicrobiaceae bacterium]